MGILIRINSEMGSLMAERFNDARLRLKETYPTANLEESISPSFS